MKTIAVYNMKGGVGKTTISAHLAYRAVERCLRTVVISADPQGDIYHSVARSKDAAQSALNGVSGMGATGVDLACGDVLAKLIARRESTWRSGQLARARTRHLGLASHTTGTRRRTRGAPGRGAISPADGRWAGR